MLRHAVCTVPALIFLAGCATIPKVIDQEPVQPTKIVKQVQCELASVYRDPTLGADLLNAANAATTLTLINTQDDSLHPGVGATQKFGDLTTSLQPKNTLSDRAARTSTLTFATAFVNLQTKATLGRTLERDCPLDDGATSPLGLSTWLRQILVTAKENTAQYTEIKYKADFTVTRTAGGGLSFQTALASVSFNETQFTQAKQNTIEVSIKIPEGGKAALPKGVQKVPETTLRELMDIQRDGATIKVAPGQTIVVQ